VLTIGLGAGCSTPSLIISYPYQMRSVKEAVAEGDTALALQDLAKHEDSVDRVLYFEEAGRVASLGGERDVSKQKYEEAYQLIRDEWKKPPLGPEQLLAYAGALTLNDNAIPYQVPGYEKIFVNTFQMLNYLESGNLEGAAVEARRTENEQQAAFRRHQDEIEKARADAEKYNINLENSDDFQQLLSQMSFSAQRVENSFQNAFSFYLTGVIWDRLEELDNAYIAYKKALEMFPNNAYLQEHVLRLARELKRIDDWDHFKRLFRRELPAFHTPQGAGRLLVILEQGFVQAKEQIFIPIFWTERSYTVALPYYPPQVQQSWSASVFAQDTFIGKTEPVCYVRELAVRALVERYVGIAIRQVLRLIIKDQLQNQANRQNDTLGLIVGIASVVTEQADRRSWLTLPNNIQIADFWMGPGVHHVTINGLGFPGGFQVPVEAGKLTVLRLQQPGGRVAVHLAGPL